MSFSHKIISLSLVMSQLTLLAPGYAGLLTADNTAEQIAAQSGKMLQNGNVRVQLRNDVTTSASAEMDEWLNQYGTARIELHTDDNFSLKESAFDFLYPLYQDPDHTLFTQMGIREHEDKTTANIGLGHRYLTSDWLLGYNVFYDASWNNHHQRWGMGVEAWRNYVRFSANGYKAISGWRDSQQHRDYEERPADGWDLRAEGWLPAFPQLGGKAAWERYYGNDVALMGFSSRQKNPYAATVGMSFTPVPLVTTGIDYKSGKGGTNEARVNLGLNWYPGVAWHKQLAPDAVSPLRQINTSRLALVERNNHMVLDYRQKETLTLRFPTRITGEAFSRYTFTPEITSRYPIALLELDDTQLRQAGGEVLAASRQAIILKLPAANRHIVLHGTAVDSRGHRSNMAATQIISSTPRHLLSLTADASTLPADGSQAARFTAHIENEQGDALADTSITFAADGGTLSAAGGKTDKAGNLQVQLTSTEPGVIHVTAIDGEQRITHQGVTFVSLAGENVLTLTADSTTLKADGQERAAVQVHLANDKGEPVAGEAVTFSTDGGILSSSGGITDGQGNVVTHLSSTRPGTFHVSARSGTREATHAGITFVAHYEGMLTTDKAEIFANGKEAATLTLALKERTGGAVAGEAIAWSASQGVLSASTGITDAKGEARVTLTGTVPASVIVTARAGDQSWTVPVALQANEPEFRLTVDKTSALGSHFDTVTYTLTAKQRDGAPVVGERVTWATDLGELSGAASTTDDRGIASITLSSYDPGVAHVQASLAGQTLAAPEVTFTEYLSLTLQYWGDTIPGVPLELYLVAMNSRREPLSGEAVSWSVDNGSLATQMSSTDGDGLAYNMLTMPKAGSVRVTAIVKGTPTEATIRFQ